MRQFTGNLGRILRGAGAAALAVFVLAQFTLASAHAQTPPNGVVNSLTLQSPGPGTLVASWDAVTPVADDYRVIWAKSGAKFKSWRDSDGNAYPTEPTYTVTGLEAGAEYKVRVRARYERARNGPWSAAMTVIVANPPDPEPPANIGGSEQGSDSDSADENGGSGSESAGDDLPSTTSTGGRLEVGGSVTGRVESRFDQDWYAVELIAGHNYVIDQRGDSSDGGTMLDPFFMGVHDAQGRWTGGTTAPDGGTGIDSRLYYRASASGRHFLSAAGNGDEATGTGTYTLSIRDLTDGDADATAAGADVWGDITDEATAVDTAGTVGGDDRTDYAGFSLSEPKQVRLELSGLRRDADLRLEGNEGDMLEESTATGRTGEQITRLLGAGTYYVAVSALEAQSGSYTLRRSVSAPTAKELRSFYLAADPDASRSGAAGLGDISQQLTAASTTGTLDGETDLIDYYAFSLAQPVSVTATLADQETDADLHLEDADGAVLTSSVTSADADESINRTLAAGTYLLRVESAASGSNSYTLSYQSTSLDPAAPSALSTLATHQAVTLNWAAPIDATVTGYQILRGPSIDSLTVIADTGTSSTQHTDTDVQPDTSYTYAVKSVNQYGHSAAVSAQVRTEPAPVVLETEQQNEDASAGTDTTATAEVDSSYEGEIEVVDDVDWIKVNLTAGVSYRLTVRGYLDSGGTLWVPEIVGIRDSSGNPLGALNHDAVGVRWYQSIHVVPPTTGDYFAIVRQTRPHPLQHRNLLQFLTGTYTLDVHTAPADLPNDDTTTRGLSHIASTKSEIDYRGDVDWIRLELRENTYYRIDVEGYYPRDGSRTNGPGTLTNPGILRLVDSSGNTVPRTSDHDSGFIFNPLVFFKTPGTGSNNVLTYHIEVTGTGGATGSYRLSVTTDDHPIGDPAELTIGTLSEQELAPYADKDWFQVDLDAHETYQIDALGKFDGMGTLPLPLIEKIIDANGVEQAASLNGGRAVFTPTTKGTYRIRVSAIAGNYVVALAGTYKMHVLHTSGS